MDDSPPEPPVRPAPVRPEPPSVRPPPVAQPRPASPRPVRPGGRGDESERTRGRDPRGGRDRSGDRGAARPQPVRQGVEPAARGPLQPVEVPTRTFTVEGEEWIATEAGRSGSGSGRDPAAPLLLLLFAPAPHPDPPQREILVPGRGLADLSEDELALLLARARPHRGFRERQEVFPDTRRKGGRGL